MSSWPNPLVPGFNPDPSVVLVDGDLLPGDLDLRVPARPADLPQPDLVEWTQIGNVATRPEQLGVDDVPTGGGVWAPTIRHHDGVFYVIVTDRDGRGLLVFTADRPRRAVERRHAIDGVGGIDPDLAWDDDGNAYVTYSGW